MFWNYTMSKLDVAPNANNIPKCFSASRQKLQTSEAFCQQLVIIVITIAALSPYERHVECECARWLLSDIQIANVSSFHCFFNS